MKHLTNQPFYRMGKVIMLLTTLIILGLGVHMNADENVIQKKDKWGNTCFLINSGTEVHINVKASQVFSIQIASNVSTGYTWELKPMDENGQKLIKFVTREYLEQEPSPVERVGAPGYDLFTFQAVAQGETSIELQYSRPWEKDTPPEKVVKIFIKID